MSRADHPPPGVPRIVLLMGEAVRHYVGPFDAEGFWTSTVTSPEDAMTAMRDLRPDAVLVDVSDHAYDSVLRAIQRREPTRPLLLVAVTATDEPAKLVRHVRELLEQAPQARGRLSLVPARPHEAAPEGHERSCPQCEQPLEWIEHRRFQNDEYDYYRGCANGCGLFCYNKSAERWVKLV